MLAVISVCCAVAALLLRASVSSDQTDRRSTRRGSMATVLTPEEKRRPEEQTFLTYPEWFLVYSPDEYADFVRDRPPSAFPFLEHVGQFWQGYWVIHQATQDDYPFNGGYHLMVMVIGASTTVEYGMKWAYEATIGRISLATRRHGMTTEERLAADVAREYADFLNREPWYNFDYIGALKRLWTETGLRGRDPIRKWERKYALTTEYALKAAYARILKQGSATTFGTVETITTSVLDRLPDDVVGDMPELTVLERYPDGTVLVDLPRYQPFTDCAKTLAEHDIGFIEVAGNRDTILISAIVPEGFDVETQVLTQPILTRPGLKRIVCHVPVNEIKSTVRRLQGPETQLEHIYDY
jgi:hypothetical protein